jgi:hypothetical protein
LLSYERSKILRGYDFDDISHVSFTL